MNILVLLRTMRDPAGFIVNRKAQKIFVNRENYILNPSDKNALETALCLAGEGNRVTAIALGDAAAEDALRQAFALGVSRAVLVCDPALRESQADASAFTTVLQRVIEHIGGADLILLGADVLDADLAQVGPRLAEALDCPIMESAHEVSSDGRAVQAIVHRWGAFHRGEADLPAVVSIARDSNKLRYPHGADLLNVYKAKEAIETVTLTDLQLTESDLIPFTELCGESFPPERQLGKPVEGNLDEMARQLADVIRQS